MFGTILTQQNAGLLCYLQLFIRTLEKNEAMVSLVSRHYMRVVNVAERLVVCLSEYLPLRSVYRISSMSILAVQGFVSRRDYESPLFFQMSFRPTCCLQSKRHSNHEVNRYVYPA